MKCREVVRTQPEKCLEETPIWRCAARMRDRNLGFLVVTTRGNHIAGVVSDRDLVTRVLAARLPADLPVGGVMSTEVVLCHEDDDLGVAEEKLVRAKKSRIVVIDDDGACTGVISLSDIARVEDPQKTGRILGAVATREARGSSERL